MPTRILLILVAVIVVAMGFVFLSNVSPRLGASSEERYIRLNDIRGTAVVHKGVEYPLNFIQQNEVALLLNSSKLEENPAKKLQPAPFEKIIIYLFNEPAIELTPLGFENDELIFSSPVWNRGATMRDVSHGVLKKTLLNTYDA